MASKDVSDQLVETLIEWGVDTVFGLPGDGINGLIEGFREQCDKIRFIQVRHEEAAAFMACGYAKYTGKLGCCLATSGPGAIHLLNGLYDAKMDHVPVLAITGMTYHDLIGQQYQQDVNTESLFRDVACFDERIMGPGDVKALTNLACREAIYNQCVSHLTFPVDLQVERIKNGHSERNVPGHTSSAQPCPKQIPCLEDLREAARILNSSERPAIICGAGAMGAREELIEVAEMVGAPIIKALLGKAVVPDEHPLSMGGLGFLGTTPSENAMEKCDVLLMVGTSFPYLNYLPKPGQAIGIQIEHNAGRMGLRYPVEVGLLGDSKMTLQALMPLLVRKKNRKFLQSLQREMKTWWELMENRETRKDIPLKPQVVAKAVSDFAADDAIISTDSGTITTWIARHHRIKKDQMFSCSGNLATMAPALPYAIAAKAAYPDRQSIAFVGDGGLTMLMGELATAVKYNLPVKIVVIKNNVLGQIKWEQIVFLGNPEYVVELQPIDFVKVAEACGAVGYHVDRHEDVNETIKRAFESDRPALVEAVVDANEPPMPPKVRLNQAVKFSEALLRGQPGGGRIALTLFRDKVDELIR